jgi:hypothetical protein
MVINLGSFLKKLLFNFIFFLHPVEALYNQEEYHYLNGIALTTEADKGSHCHNYTEFYSQYFSPLREKPIKFLEIGIFKGASVQMWEKYFPHADLHFIDITFQNVEHFSNRSHYHLCDQSNPHQLKQFIQLTGGDFDVILDDGGHTMTQQITSFCTLFPHIKSGGMYIIEDLHTSYWTSYGGGGPDSTVNFLKTLIDEVNHVGAKTGRASHLNLSPAILSELNIYQKQIYSIHFYDSAVIIIKR